VLSPAVFLDASPWLSAHPHASLRACYAGRCETIDATTHEPVQLAQFHGILGTRQLLTIASQGSRPQQLINEQLSLKRKTTPGPCGSVDYWGMNTRLSSAGKIAILGWSGSYLQPLTDIPTPGP